MSEKILNEIKQAIDSIRFGSVEIVIHDSRVVQIERKEKLRFGVNNNDKTDRITGSLDK